MGIFQIIILAVLITVAVTIANFVAHRMIQKYEAKKQQEEFTNMMVQNMMASAQTQPS